MCFEHGGFDEFVYFLNQAYYDSLYANISKYSRKCYNFLSTFLLFAIILRRQKICHKKLEAYTRNIFPDAIHHSYHFFGIWHTNPNKQSMHKFSPFKKFLFGSASKKQWQKRETWHKHNNYLIFSIRTK